MIHNMDVERPDDALLEEIEAHAVHISREAGKILLKHFNQPLEVQFKDKHKRDPVTIADGRSEEYLNEAIKEKFPQHCILGEEGTLNESDSPFVWVIDPLDGTVNFLNGLPLFAVSIGVLWQGQPIVGSIYVPVSHSTVPGVYHARHGNGAYFNGEKIAPRASTGRPLSQFPPLFHLSGRSRKGPHEARNIGSVAFEMSLTVCGVFQYAVFGRPKIWDVAAGLVLVNETGGLALTRPKRGSSWLPLTRFHHEPGGDSKSLEDLRGWSAPLVVGDPDVVRQVVKDIRSIRHPLAWLYRLRRRPEKKDKGREKVS